MLSIKKCLFFVIAISASYLAHAQDGFTTQPASSTGNFLQNLFKGAAETALKQQLEKNGLVTPQQQGVTNAIVQEQQQVAPQQLSYDPGCKRGQLINPYYVMLQANLLPDASLADMPCVSSTQIQGLHAKYSKMLVK